MLMPSLALSLARPLSGLPLPSSLLRANQGKAFCRSQARARRFCFRPASSPSLLTDHPCAPNHIDRVKREINDVLDNELENMEKLCMELADGKIPSC
jgi:hypothetical protein